MRSQTELPASRPRRGHGLLSWQVGEGWQAGGWAPQRPLPQERHAPMHMHPRAPREPAQPPTRPLGEGLLSPPLRAQPKRRKRSGGLRRPQAKPGQPQSPDPRVSRCHRNPPLVPLSVNRTRRLEGRVPRRGRRPARRGEGRGRCLVSGPGLPRHGGRGGGGLHGDPKRKRGRVCPFPPGHNSAARGGPRGALHPSRDQDPRGRDELGGKEQAGGSGCPGPIHRGVSVGDTEERKGGPDPTSSRPSRRLPCPAGLLNT